MKKDTKKTESKAKDFKEVLDILKKIKSPRGWIILVDNQGEKKGKGLGSFNGPVDVLTNLMCNFPKDLMEKIEMELLFKKTLAGLEALSSALKESSEEPKKEDGILGKIKKKIKKTK